MTSFDARRRPAPKPASGHGAETAGTRLVGGRGGSAEPSAAAVRWAIRRSGPSRVAGVGPAVTPSSVSYQNRPPSSAK